MRYSFFHSSKMDESLVVESEIFVPDYYTRWMGLKGIFIVKDAAVDMKLEQAWMELAEQESLILVLVSKAGGQWQEGDGLPVFNYIQERASWISGGYGILSSYRYVAGVGLGCIAVREIMESYSNPFARIELFPEENDFTFEKLWQNIKGFRKIVYGLRTSEVFPVRDMSHLTKYEARVDGAARTWYAYIPPGEKTKKLPLVIALHGITNNGEKFMEMTGWDLTAEKNGFAVVTPTGYMNRWNFGQSESYPSDIQFIQHILNEIKKECEIDEERIYLMGFSMGGAMVHSLQCELPHTFAASASFSGYLAEKDEDTVVLLKGGNSGKDAYKNKRTDIPRIMWMFYGEEEKPQEYPGNLESAREFWLQVMKCKEDNKTCIRSNGEVEEWAYPGEAGELRIIAQKNTGHAIHPELMEYIYENLFGKSKIVR